MGNGIYEITEAVRKSAAKIIVVGVGGAGNNAIDRMIEDNVEGVKFLYINTDKQQLDRCKGQTLQIGEKLTKGLGAGAKPEIGEKAAEENKDDIEKELEDADMVFVTCGMGGGTGSGAAPVVAGIAKQKGILTVGIVTKPFGFEGRQRTENAIQGLAKLRENVDTLVVIPNDKILQIVDRRTSMPDALKKADEVLQQAVAGITNLINGDADINLDFADIQTVMKDGGLAHVGIGTATGEDKATKAVKIAVNSPLLETHLNGATDIIVNLTGDFSLIDSQEVNLYIQEFTGADVNVIFGASYDNTMEDEVTVTLIATGLGESSARDAGAINRQPQQPGMFANVQKTVAPQQPVRPAMTPEQQTGSTAGLANRPVNVVPATNFEGLDEAPVFRKTSDAVTYTPNTTAKPPVQQPQAPVRQPVVQQPQTPVAGTTPQQPVNPVPQASNVSEQQAKPKERGLQFPDFLNKYKK